MNFNCDLFDVYLLGKNNTSSWNFRWTMPTENCWAGREGGLSELMVQLRLNCLLLVLEKTFFKWKQIERALAKAQLPSSSSPLTRTGRQAWKSLFKGCQWHSFMLMDYKSLRAHAWFHFFFFIWISDVKEPNATFNLASVWKPGCRLWSTPSVEQFFSSLFSKSTFYLPA